MHSYSINVKSVKTQALRALCKTKEPKAATTVSHQASCDPTVSQASVTSVTQARPDGALLVVTEDMEVPCQEYKYR